ncbi:MAG TPA: type II secretion system protein [Desulfuromonadaceae bacterium]|jgi:general secretion pathway protein H
MNRRGFTLIEIVVVLAIIALAMTLVIPRLPAREHENLKSSASTLATTLRYLQDRAATARTNYYLRIEPGTETLKILEAGADGSEKEPGDPLLQKRPLKEDIQVADVVIPRLGKITEGQVRLDVGMGGLRDFVIFHLRSPDGSFWTVMAFPSSGKVKLYQGYQEEPL